MTDREKSCILPNMTHDLPALSSPASGIRKDAAPGILRLLLCFLFGDPFAKLFAELERLFAAWRDGTLPVIPPRQPAPQVASRSPRAASPRRYRARAHAHRRPSRAPRARRAPAYAASPPLPPDDAPISRIDRPPKRKNRT